MKLAICGVCRDGFFLNLDKRSCNCGRTSGNYDANGSTAVLNGPAISIALGNGSVHRAEQEMLAVKESTNDTADRDAYIKLSRIEHAWVRPNSGPGNPHTRSEQ